ncbi:unnamed protein product [Rhizophagus irregularis]|nr:unnamed protein product [Rhizophagus irregularis]
MKQSKVLENHEHEISNQAIKTILKKRGFFDDVHVISDILKPIKEAILILERTYKEFDEDIYLLAFFLYLQYKGAGIHNTQFKRIQKTALNIWKNLGYKKTSGLELKAQLRKYLDQDNPYSAPYSNNDEPFHKRSLNHIGNSISNDDVQKIIDNLFKKGDILNENEDEEEEYEEPPNIQKESVDEMLNIEQVIDLELENDDDWNPEKIV